MLFWTPKDVEAAEKSLRRQIDAKALQVGPHQADAIACVVK
ncbi:MAG: hypothetical protein ACRDAX_09875 [Propionibacteriaceae bacterium]